MSLRAPRTLVAIAKYGSFARAAEAVCLTQSAVSLHVRSLEEDFNAQLFDRTRRVPVLTDAGHRAVERAREILTLYDGIASELGENGELAAVCGSGPSKPLWPGHCRRRSPLFAGRTPDFASW